MFLLHLIIYSSQSQNVEGFNFDKKSYCKELRATKGDILFPLKDLVKHSAIGTICVFDIFDLPESRKKFVKIVVEKGRKMGINV